MDDRTPDQGFYFSWSDARPILASLLSGIAVVLVLTAVWWFLFG